MNYEARALSALIKNKDMPQAMTSNAAQLFVSHKNIWDFIYDYYRRYREVPTASVVLADHAFDYDEEIEGATGHHLTVLRTKTTEQELDRLLKGAGEALGDGHSAQAVLEHLVERTALIQRNGGISRCLDVRDADDASREFERRRELAALHGGQIGIPTGFKYIDDNYPTGFAPGHFVVGLGYSGLGKTWFIIQLAINAWLNGYKPMIINLEMTPEELRDRIYFLISTYKMDELVRAEIDPDDFARWAKDYMEDKVEFLLFGNEGFGAFTTDMVAGKIEQYKPDIVFCDYLQLFSDRANSTNEVSRAKNTAREFKELAQASLVPVVVISAVTGKDKKDRQNPPSLAQVAWSSEIEYAANLAFAVHTYRDAITQKAKETEIVILKNRHGGYASFNVKMDLDNGVIEEVPEDEMLKWQDDQEDPMIELMKKAQ